MKKKFMSAALTVIALASFGTSAQTTITDKAKNATENVVEKVENVAEKTGTKIKKGARNVENGTKEGVKEVRNTSKNLQNAASKEMKMIDNKINGAEKRACKKARAAKCTITDCEAKCDSVKEAKCNNLRARSHHRRITQEIRQQKQSATTPQSANAQKADTQK